MSSGLRLHLRSLLIFFTGVASLGWRRFHGQRWQVGQWRAVEGSGGQCVICQPNGDELSSKETSQLSQCQRLMISEPVPGLDWSSWPPRMFSAPPPIQFCHYYRSQCQARSEARAIRCVQISLHLLTIWSQICWWPLLNSYLSFLTLLSNTDISKIFRPLKIFNKITPNPSEICETWALT